MVDYADWKRLYLKVIFESNRDTLPQRIHTAERALRIRFNELAVAADCVERRRVEAAMRILASLKQIEMAA